MYKTVEFNKVQNVIKTLTIGEYICPCTMDVVFDGICKDFEDYTSIIEHMVRRGIIEWCEDGIRRLK